MEERNEQFEHEKKYFQEQIQDMQQYYQEILRENERLQEDNKTLRKSLSAIEQRELGQFKTKLQNVQY